MASGGPRVLVYGDLNMDLIVEVPRLELRDLFFPAERAEAHHGGVGGNVAEALAALGYPVSLVARVGDDCFGRELVERLRLMGVDTSAVKALPGEATGLVVALVLPGGRRTLTGARNANAHNNLGPREARRLVEGISPRHVHVSGYTVYNTRGRDSIFSLLQAAREQGSSTSIDLEGIAMHAPTMVSSLRGLVDLVMLNEDELRLLMGEGLVEDQLRSLHRSLGTRWTVVKRGPRGAMGFGGGGALESPALGVRVVDTTGAGDAFNAGLIAGYLAGLGLEEALELANLMGGYSASLRGARVGKPGLGELLGFYRRGRGGREPPGGVAGLLGSRRGHTS